MNHHTSFCSFNSRLIEEYKGKISKFESEKGGVREECEKKISEIRKDFERSQSLCEKYSREKVEAQQSAADSREKYLACCAVLAKEKLMKRHQEIKAMRSTSKAASLSGQKNMQMLVYKQTISTLHKKLEREKKHASELEKSVSALLNHGIIYI